jgi:hypothetical protein
MRKKKKAATHLRNTVAQPHKYTTSAENPPRAGYKEVGGKQLGLPCEKQHWPRDVEGHSTSWSSCGTVPGHSAPAGTAAAVHPRKRSGGRSCPAVLYAQGEKETAAAEKQRDVIQLETTACKSDIYWRRWRPDARCIGGSGGQTREKKKGHIGKPSSVTMLGWLNG